MKVPYFIWYPTCFLAGFGTYHLTKLFMTYEFPYEALFILAFLLLALVASFYWIYKERPRKLDKDITSMFEIK